MRPKIVNIQKQCSNLYSVICKGMIVFFYRSTNIQSGGWLVSSSRKAKIKRKQLQTSFFGKLLQQQGGAEESCQLVFGLGRNENAFSQNEREEKRVALERVREKTSSSLLQAAIGSSRIMVCASSKLVLIISFFFISCLFNQPQVRVAAAAVDHQSGHLHYSIHLRISLIHC